MNSDLSSDLNTLGTACDAVALDAWFSKHPELHSLRAGFVDLNGQWRVKHLPREAHKKLAQGSLRMPLSACQLDIWGREVEAGDLLFESGDADGVCLPTGRAPLWVQPAHSQAYALVPMQLFLDDGQPFLGDPRQQLRQQVARLTALGLQCQVAPELEFFLLKTDPAASSPHLPPLPVGAGGALGTELLSLNAPSELGDFFDQLFALAAQAGIPLSGLTSESGTGQFELNLAHTDPLIACDQVQYLKLLLRELAAQSGFVASFMAKPLSEFAGSGMHWHLSLWDAAGSNAFAQSESGQGEALLQQCVAGLLALMPASTLAFAPHANSYRRLRPNSYAPTAASWAHENRTAAVRIPQAGGAARRIEHRVAGADSNPYWVLSLLLGSMWHGMEQQLQPPPPLSGNTYQSKMAVGLPCTWPDAIQAFEQNSTLKQLLGESACRWYAQTKRQELETFLDHIDPFEHQSYLHRP